MAYLKKEFKRNKYELSIILACYNEGSTLKDNVDKILKVANKLDKTFEIIFVEDKSSDQTKKTVVDLVGKIKDSKAIFHSKNLGRGRSVADGMRASQGSICGYLDVDLEVSPTYIPLFISEIESGFDAVFGKRFYEGYFNSVLRYLASKAYALLVRYILKVPIEDTESGYKFFKRSKILPTLDKVVDKGWFWDTEICARAYWAGLKISQVPVLFIRRKDKKSTVKLFPDTIDYLVKIIKFRDQIPIVDS